MTWYASGWQDMNPWGPDRTLLTSEATKYTADKQAEEAKRATEEKWREYYETMEAQKKAGAAGRSGLESLVNSYNTAFNAATAVNSQHYQEMQDIVNSTSGQGRADILSTYGAEGSKQMQALARLGMGNTTINSSLQAGNLRSQSAALNTLADTEAKQKLDVIGQYGAIMKQNTPDLTAIQALIQSLTSGGGAYGTAAAGDALGGLTQGAGTGYQTTPTATTPATSTTPVAPKIYDAWA